MKKSILITIIILAIVLILSLSGCKKKQVEKNPEPTPTPVEKPVEEVEDDEKAVIMEEFQNIVESDNEPIKTKNFIDENIGKLSQLEGDKMIDALEKSLEKHLEKYTDKILALDKKFELMDIAGSELFFPEEKIKDIKDEKLREEVKKLYDSMYKLINLEGSFYPYIDYFKLQAYSNNITDEWKEYLGIRAMDSNDPPLVDAGLRIGYGELANRIIKAENYLNKYIDSQRQDEMLLNYENKLRIYLKGIDNSPIADPDTKKIYDDVLDSYVNTSHMENHVTAHILYKYVEELETNNYIIDEDILNKADELIEEALEILSEFK